MNKVREDIIKTLNEFRWQIQSGNELVNRIDVLITLQKAFADQILSILCAEIKEMGLSDEEIRKYYLGGRLTAVKDCLKALLSKVVNTLEVGE